MQYGRRFAIWNIVVPLLFSLMLSGCSGNGGDGDAGGGNDGGGPQPTTSAFNSTFSGNITTTQGGFESDDSINLSLTVESPLNGTFFRRSDGAVGTISGNAEGNTATFTGTSTGICPDSFSGTMTLMDDNTALISMAGEDCNGSFSSVGELSEVECIDLTGTWRVSERADFTCTIDGGSETETVSGTATVPIEQNGCNVRYVIPFPGVGGVPREGEIEGNAISFSGDFAVPLVGGVSFTQNIATLAGRIVNEKRFTLDGSGIATGTADGLSFSCTGDSTAEFNRCYDVAVAVLRGGPFPPFDIDIGSNIAGIKDQATEVDPQRIIAGDFRAFPDQLSRVGRWLDEINEGCDRAVKVVLVGYSLGGNAVRLADFSNMCARITIDPINPDLIPTSPDQHDRTFTPVTAAGRIVNRLSTSASFLGLRGYHIASADEQEEPDTNHLNILSRVRESGLVSAEVQQCLAGDDEDDLNSFAGTYVGTFSGDDSGTLTIVIDSAGNVTGSGVSTVDGLPFDLEGAVNSAGELSGTTTTEAHFSGTVSSPGEISGTWVSGGGLYSGTFEARRQQQ